MIRLNRFNLGNNPVATIDSVLRERLESMLNGSEPHHLVKRDVAKATEIEEGLKTGDYKRCKKCDRDLPIEFFRDSGTKSGFGRLCRECKTTMPSTSASRGSDAGTGAGEQGVLMLFRDGSVVAGLHSEWAIRTKAQRDEARPWHTADEWSGANHKPPGQSDRHPACSGDIVVNPGLKSNSRRSPTALQGEVAGADQMAHRGVGGRTVRHRSPMRARARCACTRLAAAERKRVTFGD